MKKIIWFILITLCAAPVFSLNIDLQQSIELARKNNKDLQASQYSLQAAKWSKLDALSNFLPRASFNSSLVRIDDDTHDAANQLVQIPVIGQNGFPNGDYIPFSSAVLEMGIYKTSYTNNITVQQPIFNGGKIIIGYQLAELAEKQARSASQNKELDIIYAVASTYFNYLKLQELEKLTRKSVESSRSHYQQIKAKLAAGTVKKSDVLQWQVKLNNAETSLSEIKNSQQEVLSMWKNILGDAAADAVPAEIDLQTFQTEIKEYSEFTSNQIDAERQEFLQKVRNESTVLDQLELAKVMMKKNLWMAKGNFLPSLNLQFDYQIESDDEFDFDGDDQWNLAAAFSLPIFSSGSNFSKMKQAKYNLLKTEKQSEYTRENYLIAAENSFNRMITKARTITDNETALELAKENHKIINQLFEEGMVTNSELLDAEAMLFSSEMNLITSYYDFVLTKYEMKKYRNITEE